MSKIEMHLNEQQINSLKSILSQSENGLHVLFENKLISEVFQDSFSENDFFEIENIKRVQHDLLQLLQFKSLNDKQNFIQSLSKTDRHRIVRAYFYIIENSLRNTKPVRH